ncbi:MAG: MscL family protein [Clostridia bacterium]|nr:MscL family protein [Clostridia bacterium]
MEKKVGAIKRFFGEFKKFITRGNVLDMAVGVIVGGAFTAIVNGMSNFILKPLINWLLALLLGGDSLSDIYTVLKPAYLTETLADGTTRVTNQLDLANSIYIDWGAFINAIINFLIIAFVLFVLVKMLNRIAEAKSKMVEGMELTEKKEVKRLRREEKLTKAQAKARYAEKLEEAKAKKAEEERVAAEKAAEEARIAEEKATANTRLLEEIRDLLKKANS